MLNETEKKILKDAAKQSILFKLGVVDTAPDKSNIPQPLLVKAGAFVTLNKNKRLRGCIGYIEPLYPLFDTVCKAAVLAAFEDTRFPSLQLEEVEQLTYEISVMYPPVSISSYDEIEIGKHGIILDEHLHSALLLPQVAIEHKMDRDEFLSALCQKAGLPTLEWQRRNIKLKAFKAEVF